MKKTLSFIFLLINLLSMSIYADPYDVDRHNMRLMLLDIQKNLNAKQVSAILPYLDKNAVVTFYDARTAVGPNEVDSYIKKMLTGPAPVLKSFTVQAIEDVPAMVYPNNTATAQGSVTNTLNFITGEKMEVKGRWTVTLIKEGNAWKIIALHFSTNLFDNPIVNSAKTKISYFIIFSLAVGFLIGYFFRRFFNPKRTTTPV